MWVRRFGRVSKALRLLIVDDDGAIRQLLKSVFEGEGFGIDEAANELKP